MVELRFGAQRLDRRDDPAMQLFRSHRLGQFVHFGLYALPAGSWHGREYEGAAEFLPKWADVPMSDWEQLVTEFRLPAFDADDWAAAAERMGARYVTITSKHHEGFCLWPSAHTDFHVGTTPFGRDLLAELIPAYERRGITVHLYYSILDWHHPDWRYRIDTSADDVAFRRYLDFAEAQVVELAERYPSIRGFWFDGTWDESVKANGGWTLHLENRLKQFIPGLVVNSRLRADEHGARHYDSNGHLMGDFESGYERRLPEPWDPAPAQRDWEAGMTISQGSWGYHAGRWASRTLKHPWELVDMLCQCTAQGGNLLINFGPRGDGSNQPSEVAIGERIGAWLRDNGAAVFDAGPAAGWSYPGWGYFTASSTEPVVYAIVTRTPASRQLVIDLPAGTTVLTLERLAGASTAAVTVGTVVDETVRWGHRADDQLVVEVDPANVSECGPVVFRLCLTEPPRHAKQPAPAEAAPPSFTQ